MKRSKFAFKIVYYHGGSFDDMVRFNEMGDYYLFFTSSKRRAEEYARDYQDGCVFYIEKDYPRATKKSYEALQRWNKEGKFIDQYLCRRHKHKKLDWFWCRNTATDSTITEFKVKLKLVE